MHEPEPRLDPPDKDRFIIAGCGHETYEGEHLVHIVDERGKPKTICPDCFWDMIKDLRVAELAELLGMETEVV